MLLVPKPSLGWYVIPSTSANLTAKTATLENIYYVNMTGIIEDDSRYGTCEMLSLWTHDRLVVVAAYYDGSGQEECDGKSQRRCPRCR